MRKLFRHGISMITSVVILMMSLCMGTVFADPTAVLMKTGTAEVGNTIKVSIKVSGDGPYGGYNGSISVDSAFFEVTSINIGSYTSSNFSSKVANKTFVDYNCNIPSDTTIVVVELKCLQEGTSLVSASLEVSSLDGLTSYNTGASANIEITKPVVLSNNCNLSSLVVSPGTLSPAFSKDTLNYSMTVDESVSSIAVTATPEDAGAKVSLNGVQNDLKLGENTVKITVTAANGDTKTYKITVTKGTPTPTPEPYPLVSYGGASLTFLDKNTLENTPSGFSWSETTYAGKSVPCLVGPDGTLLFWLLSDSGKALYTYDLSSQTVSPCYGYDSDAAHYMFISFPKDFAAPSGYEKAVATINGSEVEVYKNISDSSLPMLVYLIDKDGHEGLYYMDEQSGLFLPFRGDMQSLIVEPEPTPEITPEPVATPTPEPTATPVPTATVTPAKTGVDPVYKTATITLAVLSALFFIMIILLLVLRKVEKNRSLTDYYDEEEYAEEEQEADEEEEQDDQDESDEVEEVKPESEHKNFYYQFGDDPDMPSNEQNPVKEEKKEEKDQIILDFPSFPDQENKDN